LKCPYCDANDDKVVDSRPAEDGAAIRRRRECLACGARFTTYEKVESLPLMVIKKDGSRQPFDREKLLMGIMKSCAKRPVTTEQIERLIDTIERVAGNMMKREITTSKIGELVLRYLRNLDEVAYIRFASVYRDFGDIHSFVEEMRILQEQDRQASDGAHSLDGVTLSDDAVAAIDDACLADVAATTDDDPSSHDVDSPDAAF
jgi:transcriptional repressor NrdR